MLKVRENKISLRKWYGGTARLREHWSWLRAKASHDSPTSNQSQTHCSHRRSGTKGIMEKTNSRFNRALHICRI